MSTENHNDLATDIVKSKSPILQITMIFIGTIGGMLLISDISKDVLPWLQSLIAPLSILLAVIMFFILSYFVSIGKSDTWRYGFIIVYFFSVIAIGVLVYIIAKVNTKNLEVTESAIPVTRADLDAIRSTLETMTDTRNNMGLTEHQIDEFLSILQEQNYITTEDIRAFLQETNLNDNQKSEISSQIEQSLAQMGYVRRDDLPQLVNNIFDTRETEAVNILIPTQTETSLRIITTETAVAVYATQTFEFTLCYITPLVENVNIRRNPRVPQEREESNIVGILSQGESVKVCGYNQSSTQTLNNKWWFVQDENRNEGWVHSSNVRVLNDGCHFLQPIIGS